MDIREIKISATPESAARPFIINKRDIITKPFHIVAVIIGWSVRRAEDEWFSADALNLARDKFRRIWTIDLFDFKVVFVYDDDSATTSISVVSPAFVISG